MGARDFLRALPLVWLGPAPPISALAGTIRNHSWVALRPIRIEVGQLNPMIKLFRLQPAVVLLGREPVPCTHHGNDLEVCLVPLQLFIRGTSRLDNLSDENRSKCR